IQHLGNTDPVSEGFTFYGSGTVGPVTNDLGMNAWFTTGSTSYSYMFTSQEMALLKEMDWALSFTVRIVSPNANNGFVVSLNDTISFIGCSSFDPYVRFFAAHIYSLPTGTRSTYNNYQYRYEAAANIVILWVNGIDTGINVHVNQFPNLRTFGGFGWGGNGAATQANWSEVTFSIIPEPSSATLFFLGGGVFI